MRPFIESLKMAKQKKRFWSKLPLSSQSPIAALWVTSRILKNSFICDVRIISFSYSIVFHCRNSTRHPSHCRIAKSVPTSPLIAESAGIHRVWSASDPISSKASTVMTNESGASDQAPAPQNGSTLLTGDPLWKFVRTNRPTCRNNKTATRMVRFPSKFSFFHDVNWFWSPS